MIPNGDKNGDRLHFRGLALLVALAAGVDAVLGWSTVTPDGISYLDLARALSEGDWARAFNGYWSPLYPALLAGPLRLLRPTPLGELAVAHLLNLGVWALAVLTFLRLLRLLAPRPASPTFSLWAAAIFIWAVHYELTVRLVTPDLLVAVVVWFAVSVLLECAGRTGTEPVAARTLLLLGVVLGLGCWVKSVLLPVGLLMLGSVGWRVRWRGLFALAPFALLAVPLVAGVSLTAGKLTLGSSGRVNYEWYINSAPPSVTGERPVEQDRLSDSRRLLTDPPVYTYGAASYGTYPLWADPGRWFDRTEVRLQPDKLLRALPITIWKSLLGYSRLQWVLLLGFLLAMWRGGVSYRAWWGEVRPLAPVWLPLLGAAGAYALINPIPRYLVPFWSVLWLMALACAYRARREELAGLLLTRLASAAVIAVSLFYLVLLNLRATRWNAQQQRLAEAAGPVKQVGIIGDPLTSFWVRWAGARVVAELPSPHSRGFFTLSPEQQARVVQAMGEAGAEVIAAESPEARPGWEQVEGTRFLLRRTAFPSR